MNRDFKAAQWDPTQALATSETDWLRERDARLDLEIQDRERIDTQPPPKPSPVKDYDITPITPGIHPPPMMPYEQQGYGHEDVRDQAYGGGAGYTPVEEQHHHQQQQHQHQMHQQQQQQQKQKQLQKQPSSSSSGNRKHGSRSPKRSTSQPPEAHVEQEKQHKEKRHKEKRSHRKHRHRSSEVGGGEEQHHTTTESKKPKSSDKSGRHHGGGGGHSSSKHGPRNDSSRKSIRRQAQVMEDQPHPPHGQQQSRRIHEEASGAIGGAELSDVFDDDGGQFQFEDPEMKFMEDQSNCGNK